MSGLFVVDAADVLAPFAAMRWADERMALADRHDVLAEAYFALVLDNLGTPAEQFFHNLYALHWSRARRYWHEVFPARDAQAAGAGVGRAVEERSLQRAGAGIGAGPGTPRE